ncbi:MAG: pilus assembly PilX N-terminal domain-containing protein, partial [Candidatus Thioglobus sp.]
MQIKIVKSLKMQSGAATLLIAVIMLIAISLVTFLTGKTVLMETKMAANNYRASQAMADADAGMDYALAYFDDGGLDHDGNGLDVIIIAPGSSSITFYNTATLLPLPSCVGASVPATNQKSALIALTGTSDDGSASRTIYQCVGTRNLLKGSGPKQTLVSGSVVDLT